MSEHNITVEGGTFVRLKTAGKYCDRDIVVTTKGVILPELNNPAAAEQIVSGYDAINADGVVVIGSNPYEMTATNETVAEQSDLIGQIAAVLKHKTAANLKSLVHQTIAAYSDDELTSVRPYIFNNCRSLKVIDLPNVTTIGANSFQACIGLSELNFPKCTNVDGQAFASCNGVKSARFPVLETIGQGSFNSCTMMTEIYMPMVRTITTQGFYWCSSLTKADFLQLESIGQHCFNQTKMETLIIRKTDGVCALASTNAFLNSPIARGEGYIYVPSVLVEEYKSATNWSTYASQIRAIEDYPDVCMEVMAA